MTRRSVLAVLSLASGTVLSRGVRNGVTSQDFLREPAASVKNLRASGPVVPTKFPIAGYLTQSQLRGAAVRDIETRN